MKVLDSILFVRKIDSWIGRIFKNCHGGNSFKKLLCITAGSSNGRTWAFEAQYLGSNPSPAAKK